VIFDFISNKPFGVIILRILLFGLIISYIQLILGFILYILIPILKYFFDSKSYAIDYQELKLFVYEDFIYDIIAVLIISIGWTLHLKTNDRHKKKIRIFIFYFIGLMMFYHNIK
tara:strand:+ start:796 stop:1137 length:342 start_codon:yes stop_codon:yes gene_type:complete